MQQRFPYIVLRPEFTKELTISQITVHSFSLENLPWLCQYIEKYSPKI